MTNSKELKKTTFIQQQWLFFQYFLGRVLLDRELTKEKIVNIAAEYGRGLRRQLGYAVGATFANSPGMQSLMTIIQQLPSGKLDGDAIKALVQVTHQSNNNAQVPSIFMRAWRALFRMPDVPLSSTDQVYLNINQALDSENKSIILIFIFYLMTTSFILYMRNTTDIASLYFLVKGYQFIFMDFCAKNIPYQCTDSLKSLCMYIIFDRPIFYAIAGVIQIGLNFVTQLPTYFTCYFFAVFGSQYLINELYKRLESISWGSIHKEKHPILWALSKRVLEEGSSLLSIYMISKFFNPVIASQEIMSQK